MGKKDNSHRLRVLECLAPEITLQLLSGNLFATMSERGLTLKFRLLHMLILLHVYTCNDFKLHLPTLPTALAGTSYCIKKDLLLHLQRLPTGTCSRTCSEFLLQGLPTVPAVLPPALYVQGFPP